MKGYSKRYLVSYLWYALLRLMSNTYVGYLSFRLWEVR